MTDDIDQLLLTLLSQTRQLNERLGSLEERFDAAHIDALAQPDQNDLLELRIHSAKLAAELSRVTVELRSEIAEVAGRTGPNQLPSSDRDADVVDLRVATHPSARRRPTAKGWQPH